ncbi:hypothetical protein [Tenacibaculum phage Larrie]|nr:hypothetical protein [Tenacibaculum phage Larrie]
MIFDCSNLITEGINKHCETINAPIGVEKDLLLVNYDDFDFTSTFAPTNIVDDPDPDAPLGELGNPVGLKAIYLKPDVTPFVFAGTDYSVNPTVTGEVKENGDTWFIHSIQFTVFNKSSKARKTLETLSKGRVIAIAVDRSTGLYELFGAVIGLKITGLERAYTGSQNSNFYTVTIATPDIAVVREPSLGELARNIQNSVLPS